MAEEDNKIALDYLVGIKAGMTRIFDERGSNVPVTVVQLIPNFITQVKTLAKDGYQAYQVGYGEKRGKLLNKPTKGILAKAKVENNLSRFFEVKIENPVDENLGKEVSPANFKTKGFVDVTGISKGKGFQGVVKRWNFAQGPLSHGSRFHRTGGSIGNRATPGKVWKNKRMPGPYGDGQKNGAESQDCRDQSKGWLFAVARSDSWGQGQFCPHRKSDQKEELE